MIWLVANWRLVLLAGAAAATIGGVAYISHLREAAAHAKAAEKAAVVQAQVSDATVKAVDHFTEHTAIIRERADRAVDQIQQAPGADAPLDPEFRGELCAALGRLRNGFVCTDDHGPDGVPQPLLRPGEPAPDPR